MEVNGKLVRSCSTVALDGMTIELNSTGAKVAQTEAMDRSILENHLLYCISVCDNNNGNCKLHNTAELMEIEHQKYPYTPKVDLNDVDMSYPFYRYDANQCIACGQCVEACQNLQVNETLSIDWEAERPRVIWDNGAAINDSSCVGCGQCVTICPCNALMEKSMLGEAGFMTGLESEMTSPMIDLVKDVEPGYSGIFAISEVEAAMRDTRTKKTKTVCTFCGVGCSFEVWTKGRKILKIQPTSDAPVNAISTCIKGKFGWDFVNSEERITKPLIRKNGAFVESTWEEALDLVGSKLGSIKQQYGKESVGFISSSKITNEEKIVADLRKNEMAERSDIFISPKQGTDQVWLMAVTKYIIDQGWHAQTFIEENVNFFEDFKTLLEKYTLEYAEQVTGISKETLIQIAEMIRDADGTCNGFNFSPSLTRTGDQFN